MPAESLDGALPLAVSGPWPQDLRFRDWLPARSLYAARIIALLRIILLPLTALEVPNAAHKSAALGPALARITRLDAEMRALRAVPGAQIKSATLTIKNHFPRWNLGLWRPHTTALTHVQIDALDGKLVKMDMKASKTGVQRLDQGSVEHP